jgi:glycosyltransferase involved in cell wall biosynthesis
MIEAIGIVVPARDEAVLIGSCMASLEAARAEVADRVETFLVLVLDACSDDSRAAAARWLTRPHRVLDVHCANVGRARAHGARCALRHFSRCDPARVWLANTDADSRVSQHWLADQLGAANQGADALAGTVHVDDWHGYSIAQVEAYRRFYEVDGPDCAHPHVHGANLGVRADAYLAAGGFAPLPTGEDHALWHALRRQGSCLVSKRGVTVATSARRQARAPQGFASFLQAYAERVDRTSRSHAVTRRASG